MERTDGGSAAEQHTLPHPINERKPIPVCSGRAFWHTLINASGGRSANIRPASYSATRSGLHSARKLAADDLETVYAIPLGMSGIDRFHDDRGLDGWGIGNLLPVLFAIKVGTALDALCGVHGQSYSRLDEADREESHRLL